MSKEYDCIKNGGCLEHNNGWCKKLKKNGLKGTENCGHARYQKLEEPVNDFMETNNEAAFRVIGKREMLFILQRQCLAKGSGLTIEDISKFSELLEFEEKISNVEQYCKSEIDSDMRAASIRIANKK